MNERAKAWRAIWVCSGCFAIGSPKLCVCEHGDIGPGVVASVNGRWRAKP